MSEKMGSHVEASAERRRVQEEVEKSLAEVEESLGLFTTNLIALEDTMQEIPKPTEAQEQKYAETRAALLQRIDWLDCQREEQEGALREVPFAS